MDMSMIFQLSIIVLILMLINRKFDKSITSGSKVTLKCVSLNNPPCQAKPTLVDITSYDILFYPFTGSLHKCSGSCNTIDDSYARVRVPNKLKNMNAKVFHLMLGVYSKGFLVQHELCQCKCSLNESVCKSKQKRNHDDYPCNCKKLNGWGPCKYDYMWNPSTCGFKCNQACKIDEYLNKKIVHANNV